MEPSKPRRADRNRERHRRRRGGLIALLVCFLLLVSGVAWAGLYYNHCQGVDPTRQPVTFTVAAGATGIQVVDDLAAKRVIRCGGLVGRLMLQKNGKSADVLAGTYQLSTGMTLDEAMKILTTPLVDVPTTSITIPEGYRITQIASLVQKKLGASSAQFVAKATGGKYSIPGFLAAGKSAEGFLFPDTYRFATQGTTSDEVIREMLGQFSTEAETLPFDRAKALGVTPYQIVIIASMIEREAKVPSDRAKIAAVIYNRLNQSIALAIDATILYADPTPDGKLSSADLEADTPYNTRIHAGLPPTPIASPGRASLIAALNPAKVDYLYYVLCGADGHHKFSRTQAQFGRDQAACSPWAG